MNEFVNQIHKHLPCFKIFRFNSPSSTCCWALFPLVGQLSLCSCQHAAASGPHSRIFCACLQLVRKLEKLEFCLFETKDCCEGFRDSLCREIFHICIGFDLCFGFLRFLSDFWLIVGIVVILRKMTCWVIWCYISFIYKIPVVKMPFTSNAGGTGLIPSWKVRSHMLHEGQ